MTHFVRQPPLRNIEDFFTRWPTTEIAAQTNADLCERTQIIIINSIERTTKYKVRTASKLWLEEAVPVERVYVVLRHRLPRLKRLQHLRDRSFVYSMFDYHVKTNMIYNTPLDKDSCCMRCCPSTQDTQCLKAKNENKKCKQKKT